MKILALITPAPGASMEAMRPHLPDEARHVWQSYKSGNVREMYLMAGGRLGAALVYEVADLEAARRDVAELPLVKAGLLVGECIQLAPFASLEGLFAPHQG